ncbi:MAG: hypothetical protein KDB00_20635 [Planctomycetales bacterium]|nr:hypothetical protein [Planctomycetales bacterium]
MKILQTINLVSLLCWVLGIGSLAGRSMAQEPTDGSVLPFPATPMASVAKPRLQDSTMRWPEQPKRLADDAPNILIVSLMVDGSEVASVELKRTVPAAFTASESFDVGADLGSTVSLDYMDKRPFKFEGTIDKMTVELK